MDLLKFDRSAFKMQTHKQADNNLAYWLSLPISERLKAAIYLNSICYQISLDSDIRMDKTFFTKRNRNNDTIF